MGSQACCFPPDRKMEGLEDGKMRPEVRFPPDPRLLGRGEQSALWVGWTVHFFQPCFCRISPWTLLIFQPCYWAWWCFPALPRLGRMKEVVGSRSRSVTFQRWLCHCTLLRVGTPAPRRRRGRCGCRGCRRWRRGWFCARPGSGGWSDRGFFVCLLRRIPVCDV